MSNDLFQPAPREEAIRDALVGGEWASRHSYVYGYYLAARELVESALGAEPQDVLFYPICFNYRHYLELHLKGLIHSSEKFYLKLKKCGEAKGEVEEMKRDDLNHTHSLHSLLNLFEERLGGISEESLDSKVRSTILNLHETDTSGQTYRYFRTTNGEESIQERKQVDLARLSERMEKVHRHLVGIGAWIDHHDSLVTSLIEQYRPEIPRRA